MAINLVRIVQPVKMKDGTTLFPGEIVTMPASVVNRLGGKVRLLVDELDQEFGSDPIWLRWRDDPKAVKQLALNLAETAQRRRGELPASYTTVAACQHCGPVMLPAGTPANVPACCWCLNRAAGLPIPRPKEASHVVNS